MKHVCRIAARINRKRLIALLPVLLAVVSFFPERAGTAKSVSNERQSVVFTELVPKMVRASKAGVSPRVDSLPPAKPETGKSSGKMGRAEEHARTVKNKMPFRKRVDGVIPDVERDPTAFSPIAMPTPSASFEGISSNDNFAAYGFRVLPPDTIGDVGPRHYVQAVNSLFRVFDKSGTPLTPPLKISSLFEGLNTPCSVRDDGDPTILYDSLADRWILSQFCKKFPPFRQMIAVSADGDPAGEYFVYEFVMPNVKLNDYAKMGVWSDAFYMTTDEFLGGDYAGSGVFAFDRGKMLAGDPSAAYVYFDLASPTTLRIGGLLPADLDGLVPPPTGSPGLFLGYTATEYGDPQDAIRIFEFTANFDDSAASTFAERIESPVSVAPFDPTSEPGRDDIKQPPPGEKLDSQSDRLMYRAAYRNFGARESIITNQTVRLSPSGFPYRAGVRVHELRRFSGGVFTARESGTIGAKDRSRFMAAAAQDHQGNLAVGYSASGAEKPPAIVYSGRLANDAAGTLRAEAEFVTGEGVQTAYGFRWGDYSGLSVDPGDGCTFWITNQYYSRESQAESPFGWLTRIGSFRFPECADEVASSIMGEIRNAKTNAPVPSAAVKLGNGFYRSVDSEGSYGPLRVPPGSYLATVSANGFRPQNAVIDAPAGGRVIRNFFLEPTAVLERSDFAVIEESCALDGAIEPGETVTVEIALRNTGGLGTTDLIAKLVEFGGVKSPSQPQSYGALPVNGKPVKRAFRFTADPALKCGDPLFVKLSLTDEKRPLGLVTIELNTGKRRIAFTEDFDGVNSPGLPGGWSTSAEGGQTDWTTSAEQAFSSPNAAFAPDPRQIGINELITPVIEITSPNAELSFYNWYELETTFLRNRLYDGSVLEISIEGGKWQDIIDAGGSFVSGGYDDGVIDSCCQNPLAGRRAWSGRSGVNQESEFIHSRVTIPASAAGRSVRFRWRIGTDIGTFRTGQFIDDVLVTDGFVCDCETALAASAPFDFDGDGKTDLSVFLPSDDVNASDYNILNSSDGSQTSAFWGSDGDIAVNSDYDGDGRADLAVFRPANKIWFILNSSDGLFRAENFGLTGDILTPADYDGDGKTDIAVYRPSEGLWYVLESSSNRLSVRRFGIAEDIPVPADYDGDGKDDVAVYRPSGGIWYILRSSDNGFEALRFGLAGDRPVPGDFDGDGRSDLAVFRPSESIWYLLGSSAGFSAYRFGLPDDTPLQADFDGDGKRDIGVFRPSTGIWYYVRSSDNSIGVILFGSVSGLAVPGIFVH